MKLALQGSGRVGVGVGVVGVAPPAAFTASAATAAASPPSTSSSLAAATVAILVEAALEGARALRVALVGQADSAAYAGACR